ncbi:MAG: hypothetical protein IT235_04720, partial [Bacteroidia bacterium]|nr:hypothetical protein [Bacteroidia bacterium]
MLKKIKKFFLKIMIALCGTFLIQHSLFAQQTAADSIINNAPPPTVVVQQDSAKSSTPTTSASDSLKAKKRAEKLTAFFDTTEVNIKEGEVFSKNLKVVSNVDVPITFKASVGYPADWRSLLNKSKVYHIGPHDTAYIPIRLVPYDKVIGNTKYMINVYLYDTIGAPLTSAYIHAIKPKITNWIFNVGPQKKIYFKNDSTESCFNINIGNEGTEPQDLFMTMGSYRKDIILLDTLGKIIKNPKYSFTVKPYSDTTMYYKVRLSSAGRNMKRIDSETYRPGKINEAKTYSIFAKSSESSLLGLNARTKYQKLDFIQLPNERKVMDYGLYSAPLTLNFTLSNLISTQPIGSLFLNGATGLNNGAMLSYAARLNASFGVSGSSYIAQPFYLLGYYDSKYTILVGSVGSNASTGIGVGGRGINASYRINHRHRAGAFFVVNPGFLNSLTYYGTGANYNYTTPRLNAGASYTHIQTYTAPSITSDYLSGTAGFSITPHQTISGGLTLSRNNAIGTNKSGYAINGGYTGMFFKSLLQTNIHVGYYSSAYTYYSLGERYTLNHSSSYKMKNSRWSFRLLNLFNQRGIYQYPVTTNFSELKTYNNSLGVARSLDLHSTIGTAFFYNIANEDFYRFTSHSRGISFNYNYGEMESNFIYGFTSQFGYNKLVTVPNAPDKFFINLFSMVRYRVYSLNLRYVNGIANGMFINTTTSALYTQNLSLTFNHQYQFVNRHFIFNNYFTYNLMPRLDRHSAGFTPTLEYYSNNGWRISITGGYYYSNSKSLTQVYNPYQAITPTNSNDVADKRIISRYYMLMLSVRKTFGVPIPFIKRRYPTLNFIAFIDINGNGKFDVDEARLENVVVNVNGMEVLTNDRGEAQLKNVPEGEYTWQAFSLEDLKGFFPNVPEKIKVAAEDTSKVRKKSVYIFNPTPVPFVKGVKLVGKIYLDREKLSPDALTALDLSGIRISVSSNGKKSSTTLTDKEGSFMFYLPYGNYVLTMDEKILGSHFRVLQNDIEVVLNKGVETMFVSFYIAENQRQIKRKRFGADGKLVNEEAGQLTNANSPNGTAGQNPNAGKDLLNEANTAAA